MMTTNTLPLFTPTETIPAADPNRVTATPVANEDHVAFWPQYCKR